MQWRVAIQHQVVRGFLLDGRVERKTQSAPPIRSPVVVWYTIANGVITEVYYPTIDTPQIRDIQYLVTDGETFFHDERRHMQSQIDCVGPAALGFKITNSDPDGRYTIEKQVIGDPHLSCLLVHTRFNVAPAWQGKLHLYVLCAPHLEIGGMHNNGEVIEARGRRFLLAYRDISYLTIAATVPFSRLSCGYVGVNDGWTDLAHNFKMDYQYDSALDGNIALTAEIDLSRGTEFTLGMGFGHTRHSASDHGLSVVEHSVRCHSCTTSTISGSAPASALRYSTRVAEHDSTLFERSVNLLLAHEDKVYPGAMIASLSIPWGEDKGDDDLGGYHLVWTRDMVKGATALTRGRRYRRLRCGRWCTWPFATRGRRFLPELLDRRTAVLDGTAIG